MSGASAFSGGVTGLVPWVWTVRDITLTEFDGQIDGYSNAHAELHDGDVGTWSLTLPLSVGWISELLTPGAGVVGRADGSSSVLFSGPVNHNEVTYDANRGTVTFTGPTDEVELASDVAWAEPGKFLNDATSRNHTSGGVDARSGVAETVLLGYIKDNIGSTAFHSASTTPPIDRRRSYLVIPTSGGHGTSGTYQANMDALLDIAKTICSTGGITWRILQSAAGQLALVIRVRADVSADVVFSKAEGSLNTATFQSTSPLTTLGIAVSDSGTVRTWAVAIDSAAETRWGRRFVAVGDGDSDVIADLATSAGQLIADGVETAGASLEAANTPVGPQFGVDYFLGDLVSTVDDSGFDIVDQLAQVVYDHSEGQGPTLMPSVGFALTDADSALVPIIRAQQAQLRTLTRRR